MTPFNRLLSALAAATACIALPAQAAGTHADHDHSTPDGMAQHMQMMQADTASGAAAQSHAAEGVVRKIDPATGKITLRHGPIPSLGMGAMTMNYQVRDKALVEGLKTGDAVTFTAEKVDGAYVVTAISRKP